MKGKRVDQNQHLIVNAIRDIGGVWIPTAGDPSIGFDGIVVYRKSIYLCEIKNGDLPPSARKLTPTEQHRKDQLEYAGVPYWIIETVEDALRMIGVL